MRGTGSDNRVGREEAEGNLIFHSTATLPFSLICESRLMASFGLGCNIGMSWNKSFPIIMIMVFDI